MFPTQPLVQAAEDCHSQGHEHGYISQARRVLRQLCAFLGVAALVASFVTRECPGGGGGGDIGYIRKALEEGYLEHPRSACCADGMSEVFVRFGRCVCCLLPLFVRQLSCHTKPFFGITPNPVNLQPHPGCVWFKSGYSAAAPWRKVRLTKQRNVDLTTDGLWVVPLNEGWVPVKARRLQDWGKLKKYVPVHKQGKICPNGVPALPEKGNAEGNHIKEQ